MFETFKISFYQEPLVPSGEIILKFTKIIGGIIFTDSRIFDFTAFGLTEDQANLIYKHFFPEMIKMIDKIDCEIRDRLNGGSDAKN